IRDFHVTGVQTCALPILISSPYGASAAVIAASLWGTDLFWAFMGVVPFTAAGLVVLVLMTMLREERIRAFQEHQAHLIEELESEIGRASCREEEVESGVS